MLYIHVCIYMYTVLMAHTVLSVHVVTHSLLVAMATHCSRHVTHRGPAQPGSAARCGRGPGWRCESDSGWGEWEWESGHIQSRDRSSGSSVRTKKRKKYQPRNLVVVGLITVQDSSSVSFQALSALDVLFSILTYSIDLHV